MWRRLGTWTVLLSSWLVVLLSATSGSIGSYQLVAAGVSAQDFQYLGPIAAHRVVGIPSFVLLDLLLRPFHGHTH